MGKDDQNIPAINPLYLVGPDSILPNPALEFNPTIALAGATTFEEEPRADPQPTEDAKHIVMVGKKQFDMMMDLESDSASSLTVAITNVKIEPLNQGTILEDTERSCLASKNLWDKWALMWLTLFDSFYFQILHESW